MKPTVWRHFGRAKAAVLVVLVSWMCLWSDRVTSADSRAEVIKAIVNLSSEQEFQRASQLTDRLLGEYPQDAQVHMAAAQLFSNMGLKMKAIEELNSAYRLNPHNAQPLCQLSGIYLQDLDLERSLYYAHRAVRVDPTGIQAHEALASVLIKSDCLSQARAVVDYLMARAGSDPRVLWLAYQLSLRNGDLNEARSLIEKAIHQSPGNWQALFALSELMETSGDPPAARALLLKVLQISPSCIKARVLLAQILEFSFHDYLQAEVQYTKLLQADPDSVTALAGLERCQSESNDLAHRFKVWLRSLFVKEPAI